MSSCVVNDYSFTNLNATCTESDEMWNNPLQWNKVQSNSSAYLPCKYNYSENRYSVP